MKSKMLVLLSILLILSAACSAPKAEQASLPPEPEQIQVQTAPGEAEMPAQDEVQAPQEQPQAIAPKMINIAIKSFKFVPADITVNAGDTVVWANEDNAPHTVESSDGTLRSDQLDKGDAYTHTFTKAGKYSYICGIHPSMKGSVTVQ